MAWLAMSKPIRFVGACALASAILFVAAQLALTPNRSSVVPTTTPTMVPLEIMIRNDELLPVESWDAS